MDCVKIDEMMEDIDAYRKTWRGRWGIFYYNQVKGFFRAPKTFYYYVKYFIQRGRRGYSDRDLWSYSNYFAKVTAGALETYANYKHGVGYPYYEQHDDVDDAYKAMQDDYREKAALFREYAKNDRAYDKEYKDRFGGLLDEEWDELMKWFVDRLPSLWD